MSACVSCEILLWNSDISCLNPLKYVFSLLSLEIGTVLRDTLSKHLIPELKTTVNLNSSYIFNMEIVTIEYRKMVNSTKIGVAEKIYIHSDLKYLDISILDNCELSFI